MFASGGNLCRSLSSLVSNNVMFYSTGDFKIHHKDEVLPVCVLSPYRVQIEVFVND